MTNQHEQPNLFGPPQGHPETIKDGRCVIHDRVLSEQEQLSGRCWWCQQEGRTKKR